MQFFDKVACFTDIHFGNKNNNRTYNNDCEAFVLWFCEEAKKRGAETCIFLGDWHHHRATLNTSTLNYSVSNVGFLAETFKNVYMIMGNHDLYYREKREINSMPYAGLHHNVHMVNDAMLEENGVALVPWLVGDEWKNMKKIKSRYVFGHFELPYFKMNAMVDMPDHGELKADDFAHPEYVFSGHFHKRQSKKNVHYLGSPFGHNYADAWDHERGAMFLDWGGEPEYVNYAGPKYITIPLSQLVDKPEQYLDSNVYARVAMDVNVSYEEANFLKETLTKDYNLREFSLVPVKRDDHAIDWAEEANIEVESVDQIVYNQLNLVDSEFIDKKLLTDIYQGLNA